MQNQYFQLFYLLDEKARCLKTDDRVNLYFTCHLNSVARVCKYAIIWVASKESLFNCNSNRGISGIHAITFSEESINSPY